MTHKLGICIPFRNRMEHLKRLVPYLSEYLTKNNIEHKFYVAHQVDEKLLNRGALKNIAAKFALNDGCDYVVWHDVDMLPHDGCDYSYPDEYPTHIATKLSKYNYTLGYDQYFGGAILFTKEQIEKVNGYSNEYWDWGQEDDDLFWRCIFENYVKNDIFKSYENKSVVEFYGNDSYLSLPSTKEIDECLYNDHTISILFNAQQQTDKIPIFLIGDKDKKFIEYPLIRKDGSWSWGISFNNSRAVTMMLIDKDNNHFYNWAKRFENLWTWVTLSYSKKNGLVYFYVNNNLISQQNGIMKSAPIPIRNDLRIHNSLSPFLIGACKHTRTFYKGEIGEIKIHNKFFENIDDIFNNDENLLLHYDFSNGIIDKINKNAGYGNNINLTHKTINVIDNILPYRREGSFYCIPHDNEGFLSGNWIKGETTAKNERRLVMEMQQHKIDYKNEGFNSLSYKLINTEMFSDNCLIINVEL